MQNEQWYDHVRTGQIWERCSVPFPEGQAESDAERKDTELVDDVLMKVIEKIEEVPPEEKRGRRSHEERWWAEQSDTDGNWNYPGYLVCVTCRTLSFVWSYGDSGWVEAMNHPFSIRLCGDSVKTVLIFLLSYGMGIGIYISTKKHYRRGEEHGSAKWEMWRK